MLVIKVRALSLSVSAAVNFCQLVFSISRIFGAFFLL